MNRRVVVTGLGVITSNAESAEAFSAALRDGQSGIVEISQFDTGPYPCKIAGEVRSLPFPSDDPSRGPVIDRASQLAVVAAEQALRDAGLPLYATAERPLGLIVGTTCGGVLSLEKISEALAGSENPSGIPDWRVQELSFFAPTRHLARLFQVTGPVNTVAIACASGAHAVGLGFDLVRFGRAPLMLVGGVDVVSRFIFRGFAALNGLGSPPYTAFDRDRSGVVLGEGAGFLVLEDLEHARARGVHVYAELLGHSFNNDGAHIVNPNPSGEGIARSFRMALEDAGVRPEDIDHLNAHGTGTIANDQAESAAIHLAFGTHAQSLPVTSIKPMIGHTSGAAGSIELIAAILCAKGHFIAPTLHYVTPDPACDVQVVARTRSPVELRTVMSANSGFGGSNAAVVFRASEGDTDGTCLEQDPEEVVITGMGVLLPRIETLEQLWDALIGPPATLPDAGPGLEVPVFDFFARSGIPMTKDARRMDRFSMNACLAAWLALQDAGIAGETWREGLGLVLGSAYACLESNEKFSAGLSKVKVNPVVYQNTVSNAVTGYLCMTLGIRGPVSVLNQGEISGASALAYGYDLVRSGRCRAVLAGGTERLCELTRLSLERFGLTSARAEGLPYRPDSHGIIPADGSAFLVLESRKSAQARGARVYACVEGYAMSSAGGQLPEEAAARVLGELLGGAVSLERTHLLGNGGGAAVVDGWELKGLSRALEDRPGQLTLSTPKCAVGDSLGASGAVSAVVGALSLARQERRGTVCAGAELQSLPARLVRGAEPGSLDRVVISSMDDDGAAVGIALVTAPSQPPR